MSQQHLTPMEQIESLCDQLASHYGEGEGRELRVAAKMLLVAVDRFRRHGGLGWSNLVREYLEIAEHDPEKFERIINANRGESVGTAKHGKPESRLF